MQKNQDSLGRAISLLQPSDAVSNVYYIGVGFYIHYGKLLGLSLASERVCINIDTVLHNRSLIKGCLELRSLFEGSCNMIGADCWELMLILFDLYRYESENMIDIKVLEVMRATTRWKQIRISTRI